MSSTPDDIDARNLRVQIGRERETIKSRDDLVAYVRRLTEAADAGAFDRIDALKYLDGLENRLFGIKGWCRNNGEPVPQQPDWRWLGRMLMGAFY